MKSRTININAQVSETCLSRDVRTWGVHSTTLLNIPKVRDTISKEGKYVNLYDDRPYRQPRNVKSSSLGLSFSSNSVSAGEFITFLDPLTSINLALAGDGNGNWKATISCPYPGTQSYPNVPVETREHITDRYYQRCFLFHSILGRTWTNGFSRLSELLSRELSLRKGQNSQRETW